MSSSVETLHTYFILKVTVKMLIIYHYTHHFRGDFTLSIQHVKVEVQLPRQCVD